MNARWSLVAALGFLLLGACEGDGSGEEGEVNPGTGGNAGSQSASAGSGGSSGGSTNSSGSGGSSTGTAGASSGGEGGTSSGSAGTSSAAGTSSGVAGTAGTSSGTAGTSSGGGGTSSGTAGTSAGTAGSSSGTAGTSSGGAGGGGVAPGACSLELDGATGKEPGGKIPVCCEPTGAEKAEIMAVFELVNKHRANNGKPPLVYDEKLEAAMQGHCAHMQGHSFFSHTGPEAPVAKFTARAKLCGTSAGAENIANGQKDAAAVMKSWTNSAGHNANMLGNYKRIGICKKGSYWGQIFGG